MSEKKYDNSGALFRNDMEGKSENFPPYGGSITVEGREYWISAWIKEGRSGKFFSLAVKPKEERKSPPAPSPQASAPESAGGGFEDDLGDIPF